MGLDIVPRTQWGAVPPTTRASVTFPVKNIVISYYTNTSPCGSDEECQNVMRLTQKMHMMVMRLPDIAFNFMIGGDGVVYEGRGWFYLPPKFQKMTFLNLKTYHIGIIGNLIDERPSQLMWESSWKVIEHALRKKYVIPEVEILCDDL